MNDVLILSLNLGFVMLVGLALVFYGARSRRLAQAATRWPITEGQGLSVQIERRTSRSKYGSQVSYVPALEYEYRVNGTRYTSRRISFGSLTFPSELEARSFLQTHFEGQPMQVHYDPQQPKNAVLLTGTAPHTLAFMIAGAVIAVFPLLLGMYWLVLD